MTRITALAFLLLGMTALLAAPVIADTTQERAIDTAKSRAQFSIQHVFVERVTGTIPIVSGTVKLPVGSLIPLTIDAALDPGKVDTGDRDRDASLDGPDYFDVKKFPEWTFASTQITQTGPLTFTVDGALTIHGVTQSAHLDVTVGGDAAHPAYHAIAHIDRHAFGMKGTVLDPAIGDVADVTLDIEMK